VLRRRRASPRAEHRGERPRGARQVVGVDVRSVSAVEVHTIRLVARQHEDYHLADFVQFASTNR